MTRWTITRFAGGPHGNHVFGGVNTFTWRQFDQLPAIVRRVIDYAPVSLGCGRAAEGLRGGASPEAVARAEIAIARRFSREETLALYGPEHPSLQASDRDA